MSDGVRPEQPGWRWRCAGCATTTHAADQAHREAREDRIEVLREHVAGALPIKSLVTEDPQ